MLNKPTQLIKLITVTDIEEIESYCTVVTKSSLDKIKILGLGVQGCCCYTRYITADQRPERIPYRSNRF